MTSKREVRHLKRSYEKEFGENINNRNIIQKLHQDLNYWSEYGVESHQAMNVIMNRYENVRNEYNQLSSEHEELKKEHEELNKEYESLENDYNNLFDEYEKIKKAECEDEHSEDDRVEIKIDEKKKPTIFAP